MVLYASSAAIVMLYTAIVAVGRIPEDPERFKNYLAEHRPPCPKCGYSLEGLVSRVCPECGQELSISAFLHAKRSRSTMPGWLESLTKAAATSFFILVLLIVFGGLATVMFGFLVVAFAQAVFAITIAAYVVCVLGWYRWSNRR